MAEQVPSIGRVVHYMYEGTHCAAIITAVSSRLRGMDGTDISGQSLMVFPPMDAPFSVIAALDPDCAPDTWHWPEHVPAK